MRNCSFASREKGTRHSDVFWTRAARASFISAFLSRAAIRPRNKQRTPDWMFSHGDVLMIEADSRTSRRSAKGQASRWRSARQAARELKASSPDTLAKYLPGFFFTFEKPGSH